MIMGARACYLFGSLAECPTVLESVHSLLGQLCRCLSILLLLCQAERWTNLLHLSCKSIVSEQKNIVLVRLGRLVKAAQKLWQHSAWAEPKTQKSRVQKAGFSVQSERCRLMIGIEMLTVQRGT